MQNQQLKSFHGRITDNELIMMQHVHCYISGSGPAHTAHAHLTARKRLALATGVGVNIAQKAISQEIQQELPHKTTIACFFDCVCMPMSWQLLHENSCYKFSIQFTYNQKCLKTTLFSYAYYNKFSLVNICLYYTAWLPVSLAFQIHFYNAL